MFVFFFFFFLQAEDGIRDLVRSRGLGDVYKRQGYRVIELSGLVGGLAYVAPGKVPSPYEGKNIVLKHAAIQVLNYEKSSAIYYYDKGSFKEFYTCLLYTSDAADERSSVDLGGSRIIKKKNEKKKKTRRQNNKKKT